MDSLFNVNGLMFWTEDEVQVRDWFRDRIVSRIRKELTDINPAWRFMGVEAPLLMPRSLMNKNYTNEDVYIQSGLVGDDELVLRPETTPGTYVFVRKLLDDTASGVRPPVCVWQCGKSFRREQDQPQKHVKLKEFYQLEFQCVFTEDTAKDYHEALIAPTARILHDLIGLPARVVESDRLPDYSRKTMDVEVDNGDKWMEVCSMSLRTDFPGKARFTTPKGKVVEHGLLVAEVAIGLDRCVYNYFERCKRS